MRRPRRSEDFREFSIVKRFSDSEKSFKEVKGSDIALIFPNSYRVAASSLSFFLVRDILHEAGAGVERFFYDPSFKKYYSLETQKPLDEFKIWAFIMQFELDLINMMKILKEKGVPLRRENRSEYHPKILIGGPITYFNPHIFKPLADYIYCGDLESFAKELLQAIAGNISPFSVPPLIVPGKKENCTLAKFDINLRPPVSSAIAPMGEFKNKLLIEVGRGCIRRCSFCMIGHLQKPARFLKPEILREILKRIPTSISLGIISATITDYPWLDELLQILENRRFSVSSMRMDGITPELLKALKRSGQRSFTVAPEAGSQKIRDILQKDIKDEHIKQTFLIGRTAGFDRIKLYFIYGVEEETEEELKAIADICTMAKNMGYKVKASMNPLIPKPGTPFENRKMQDMKTLREKEKFLKSLFKRAGITAEFESIRESTLQYKIANFSPEDLSEAITLFEENHLNALLT